MDLNTKGIYRFTDPLKYFNVRITLRKATSSVLLEQKQEKDFVIQDEREILPMKELIQHKDAEKYTFSWQEKVFSQDELDWYSQKRDYQTFLENKYHEDVEKLRNEVYLTQRLYTYTEADISGLELADLQRNHQKSSDFLLDEQSTLRVRVSGSWNTRPRRWSNRSCFAKPSLIDKKKMESRNKITLPMQTMCIMADIRSQVNNSGSSVGAECSEEVLLCKIEVDSNGVLRITPDFTRDTPYCIQNNRNEKFEYTIENVSQQPTKRDADEEKELKKELYRKYLDTVRSNVGSDFCMPAVETLKLFAFGEIVSAYKFEGSNLCIFFYIDLPKNWSTNESSWLTGVTQRCKTTIEDCEDVAYFSCPFEGELTLTLGDVDSEDVHMTPPTLLMEVLSYDIWGCVRTEGYGHMSFPLLPGSYNIEVCTWRPIGNSLKSKMKHYFTGGFADLEDMTYVAVPNTFSGKELSRLGFTTESSGTVSIRMHIVQQSRYFIKSEKKRTDLLDRLTKKSQDNIALVLSAFQRARQRMLAARRKILTSK